MAERSFEETFHQTQPDRFYDDTNVGSHQDDEAKPSQPDVNPYYVINEQPAPQITLPMIPSQRSVQKIPNLSNFKPSLFDGKTDPRLWLMHFESLSRAFLMNDDQRYSVVSLFLRHPASTFFQNNEHLFENNWIKFKDLFVSRFIHSMHDLILTESIIREKQIDDDLESYWENKVSLIRLTSPNMNQRDMVNHLFSGLNDALRLKVMQNMVSRKCETVEELRALVKETHELMKYRKSFKKSEPSYFQRTYTNAIFEKGQAPKSPPPKPKNYQEDPNLRRLEHSINNINKVLKKVTFNPNLPSQPEDSDKEGNQSDNEETKPKIIDRKPNIRELKKQNPCFNCGKTGHWANECRQKKQGNRQKRD